MLKIQKDNNFIIWYREFFNPLLNIIKDKLLDSEKKENIEISLESQTTLTEEDIFNEKLKLYEKPNLKSIIKKNFSKVLGNDSLVLMESSSINLLRKNTESLLNKHNSLLIKPSSNLLIGHRSKKSSYFQIDEYLNINENDSAVKYDNNNTKNNCNFIYNDYNFWKPCNGVEFENQLNQEINDLLLN